MFTGIMKEFSFKGVLHDTLLSSEYFLDGYCFRQDNDPKHKSKGMNYAVRSSIVVSHAQTRHL